MRTISQKLSGFLIVKIFNIIKFFKTFSHGPIVNIY